MLKLYLLQPQTHSSAQDPHRRNHGSFRPKQHPTPSPPQIAKAKAPSSKKPLRPCPPRNPANQNP